MNDLNGIYIDAHHQMTVEKVDVSERYRQARVIIPGLDEQLSLIVPLDYSRAWELLKYFFLAWTSREYTP